MWRNKYSEIEIIGSGGNANVFKVKNNKEEIFALKDIRLKRNSSKKKKNRFKNEVTIMKDNYREIDGILPIIDFCINDGWYVMPISVLALNHIKEKNLKIEEIIVLFIELCETLEKLHNKEISHRDIKPSNIFFYKERLYFGDFGLVHNPNDTYKLTKHEKAMGAVFTMAPEMRRDPFHSDGKKADVFSLAKTLWMFLTNEEKGFDGGYNYLDLNHGLSSYDIYKNIHLVEIDKLLKISTDNNPEYRPSISTFKENLKEWLIVYKDFYKSQESSWNFINEQIFGSFKTNSASWADRDTIINLLNTIGRNSSYKHTFFPYGGGLDFEYSKVASESECIKIYLSGCCCIIKPKKLIFQGFNENYKWNYFLLELDELVPIYSNPYDSYCETLVEDNPGHYVYTEDYVYGVYDYDTEMPLPDDFEVVHRYCKGKFLIVIKTGPYNGISSTYDGRHSNCSSEEFKLYIEELIKNYDCMYDQIKNKNEYEGLDDREIEELILRTKNFHTNPFKIKNRSDLYQKEFKNKQNDYIVNSFKNLVFSNLIEKYKLNRIYSHKYIFRFIAFKDYEKEKNISYSEILNRTFTDNLEIVNSEYYYLCNDGKIKKYSYIKDEDIFYLDCLNNAINFNQEAEKEIREMIIKNSSNFKIENLNEINYMNFFEIISIQRDKPRHLFTKKEIKDVMKNADDRKNNQLVIDDNGYVKVLTNNRYQFLYPVRHVIWNSRNSYVGKYSDLSTLEDTYISILHGWLIYLETKNPYYVNYIRNETNEIKLINEIKKYY